MERAYDGLLRSYLGMFPCVAVIGVRQCGKIKHAFTVNARELRGLGDFVREYKARLGLVVTNDCAVRRYDEKLVGLPFNWL